MKAVRFLISCFTQKVSFFKTLRFNFHYLPFKTALKLPVYIYKNVKLISLKGKVELNVDEGKIFQGMILIGYEYEPSYNYTVFNLRGGTIVFKGAAYISRGTRLTILGLMVFGAWSGTSYDVVINCFKKIVFGATTLIGYESFVSDSDNHPIYIDGKIANYNQEIIFGYHNWIAARVVILKGSVLGNNNVVGIGSIINKAFSGNDQLIVGNPAKVVRTNIDWKEEFEDDSFGNL